MNLNDLRFERIEKINDDVKDLILNYHYAKRMTSISHIYGAYFNDELIGCLTVGKPASRTLCTGICGKDYAKHVYELNRLVFKYEIPNAPSKLIGYALKDLKKYDLILVSYADDKMKHKGYIYQATNWLYTGITKSRTDPYTPKNTHHRHLDEKLLEQNKHLRVFRSQKHRYVYIAMSSKKKYKQFLELLNYPIMDYPKGEKGMYILGNDYSGRQIRNNKTKEIYFEK